MRELIVAEFITLDGVIQAPGGADEDTEGGFQHGGWTVPYWHDDIGAHFFQALAQADAVSCWDARRGKCTAARLSRWRPATRSLMRSTAFRKYVVSTTLKSAAAWRNSTLISSNVAETVRELKQQPGKNILVDGSSVLMRTLIQEDLVDEYMLHVYPLVLGGGKRLFPAGTRVNLNLVESQALPTGVVFQRYRPAR